MPQDAPVLADLLNEIIAIGGTTAHEAPFSPMAFAGHYLTGPDAVCCHAAFDGTRALGFQVLATDPSLPPGWLDIGICVRPAARGTGAGTALFAATLAATLATARGKAGVINATIRADNAMGLRYYTRTGFQDYATDPAFSLQDGRVVGRVSKRYDLV